VRRKFGMLFQSAALFDSMTVAENVAFALRRDRSLTEKEIAAKWPRCLKWWSCPGRRPRTLPSCPAVCASASAGPGHHLPARDRVV